MHNLNAGTGAGVAADIGASGDVVGFFAPTPFVECTVFAAHGEVFLLLKL